MTVISDCGTYRYTLTRHIPCILRWVKPALFIMLNPSIADTTINDPTITRCINYCKKWYHTDLTVVNLFALRATDPKELKKHLDPIGPENDRYLKEEIEKHLQLDGIIIAAWGANKYAKERAEQVLKMFPPGNLRCLEQNKDGSPKHPLYCRAEIGLKLMKEVSKWYKSAKIGECCGDNQRCKFCEVNGNCEACDSINGRNMEVVSASTCDECAELTMHELMVMDSVTQLGYCPPCAQKLGYPPRFK